MIYIFNLIKSKIQCLQKRKIQQKQSINNKIFRKKTNCQSSRKI
jgi:hypothetical protein